MTSPSERPSDQGSVTTVAVGRYLLDVGRRSGTSISLSTKGKSGDSRPLAIAIQRAEDGRKPKKPAVAALADGVEDASEATAAAERAAALFTALAEGKVLDPKVLSSEIDGLLALLERLDRDGRWQEALRLAQSLSALLALVLRWAELLKSLSVAARAAEKLGDWPALAWARHELGTLHIAAEDPSGADERLGQAREIRQRLGDRRGLAATDRNLQVLCQHLRQLVRDGELITKRGALQRVMRFKVAPFAVALALLVAAVGGSAFVLEDGGGDGLSEASVVTAREDRRADPGDSDRRRAENPPRRPDASAATHQGSDPRTPSDPGTPSDPPTTDPPISDPPISDPPISDPPISDPPISDPPVSDPPVSDPPVTDPPVSDPPVTDPPVTDPPITDPPTTDPG